MTSCDNFKGKYVFFLNNYNLWITYPTKSKLALMIEKSGGEVKRVRMPVCKAEEAMFIIWCRII